MIESSSDRPNMKKCKSMNILLNLDCNQVCKCNSFDLTSKTLGKQIKVDQNLHEWTCLKYSLGMNVDLERMNVEDATKDIECIKGDLECWKF